jgi:hypothetical protein
VGLVSYYDASNQSLKTAHCLNVDCSAVTTAALEFGSVGEFTSITIGPDGLGLVSYYDRFNGDLKLGHCSNVACSTSTSSKTDSADDVGLNTSVTIGVDGLGLISYTDNTNAALKVAHLSNQFGVPYFRRR